MKLSIRALQHIPAWLRRLAVRRGHDANRGTRQPERYANYGSE